MKVKDHSVSQEEFSLLYNEKLHMYTTSPKPKKELLSKYYESEDYISHTDSARGLFEKAYQYVKGITLSRKQKLIKSYLPEKGSVLDLGSGTGDFLAYMQRKGWKATGMEPNTQARTSGKSKGVSIASSLDQVQGSYDVISMWHVLEHVYDLQEQISWLKERLHPNGYLFIAVPNFESYDAQYYKEFWAAYDVPRHLYHFSQKAMEGLFRDLGFQLVKTHPMVFDAYYVSMLSEKYKVGNMRFLKAILTGFRSNRKARKSGNYSSLIYVMTHK